MFRAASRDDLVALRDLERAASLAALGHVFPPERYPYPDDAVLTRWAIVLDDPEVEVLVAEEDGELTLLAAYDDSTLRHLAVRPDRWGRGLASAAVEEVLRALDERGCRVASLWCLEENRRARDLYERLGWQATEDRREAPWPPHPVEMRYTRRVPRPDR